MVEEVRTSVEIGDTGMVGKTATLLWHDDPAVGPGPGGAATRGIGNIFAIATTICCKDHVIGAIALVNPGAFFI
jgi:hypothetical protein